MAQFRRVRLYNSVYSVSESAKFHCLWVSFNYYINLAFSQAKPSCGIAVYIPRLSGCSSKIQTRSRLFEVQMKHLGFMNKGAGRNLVSLKVRGDTWPTHFCVIAQKVTLMI